MMSDMLLKDLVRGERRELGHRGHSVPLPPPCALAPEGSCVLCSYSRGRGPKHRAVVPTSPPKLTKQEANIMTSACPTSFPVGCLLAWPLLEASPDLSPPRFTPTLCLCHS